MPPSLEVIHSTLRILEKEKNLVNAIAPLQLELSKDTTFDAQSLFNEITDTKRNCITKIELTQYLEDNAFYPG